MRRSPVRLSRRAFLAGSAGAALLAACGGGDEAGPTTSVASTVDTPSGPSLVRFFGDDFLVAGVRQRATFGVADAEGVVSSDVPPSLDFIVAAQETTVTGAPITVVRRSDGLPRAYFPLVFTVPQPGFYTALTEIDGVPVEASFEVVDRAEVALPQVGEVMSAIDTPTVSDGRGVNPICTAEPQCPLHDVTLTDALVEGRPLALLVSTPKFCQVEICGPVLDVLLAQQAAFPDVRMIHAEVYTDETTETLAPVIDVLGMTYEPALFVASSTGTVTARLDNIYDTTELGEVLQTVS